MKDHVAIVTGAGSEKGIGKQVAFSLAKKGAIVVVTDLNGENAKYVAEQLKQEGYKSIGLQMDTTSKESVQIALKSVVNQYGKVDILINNAGISLPTRILEINEVEWDKVLDVNLKGVFFCTQEVLPLMIENRYGRIVNMASVAGKRGGGVFGGVHYAASKAGVFGFSKAVAREVSQYGITVNCVAPGMIDTGIFGAENENVRHKLQSNIPIGRPGATHEVAAAVSFLASKEASYITGEGIDVNGGLHMD
jgi:3-oxoacyl-[acyl-carrier protein] reductase